MNTHTHSVLTQVSRSEDSMIFVLKKLVDSSAHGVHLGLSTSTFYDHNTSECISVYAGPTEGWAELQSDPLGINN